MSYKGKNLDLALRKCVETNTGCWEFNGATSPGGYGFVRVSGKNLYAHRFVYEQMVADIPDGLQLDHLCRNRRCVNPAHLEPVTPRINTLRGTSAQAINAAKTECIRGHKLSGDNVRIDKTGRRICRRCKRDTQRQIRGAA